MKKQSHSNPSYYRHLTGHRSYFEIIDAIQTAWQCGQMQAESEFERALVEGEIRRIWPENNSYEKPALYEIAK